jgi:hypothetical protein
LPKARELCVFIVFIIILVESGRHCATRAGS